MNNNKSNNTVWAVIIGIIVVLAVIFFVVRDRNNEAAMNNAAADQSVTDNSALNAEATVTPTEDLSTGDINAATPAASISYNNALALYAGKRIQFDDICQAVPNVSTFTDDTTLMLDNRSANSVDLHLGFMGDVTIKPWGFKLVEFSSATLPRAVIIDCNQSQNVATISLQK